MKARSGFRSGGEASRKSKRAFAPWREQPVRCERCGEDRSFYDFTSDNELCDYCVGMQGPLYWENKKGDGSMGLKDWAKKESESIEKERRDSFPPTWTVPQGTSTVQVLDEEARDITTRYGPAVVFAAKVKGTKHSWIINKTSPMLRQLITLLATGATKIRVTRTGTKMQTRYTLEKAV